MAKKSIKIFIVLAIILALGIGIGVFIYNKSINKVTIDEVLELNKKIHLDTIFFLKGDNNE